MNLNTVMDQIGTQLDTISGLNVYDFPSDHISPPAAVVAWPDEVTFDLAYARGMDRITLPVLILVGKANDRASRDTLGAYLASTGATSVKAVLEAGTYTAFDTVRVTRAEFDVVRVAGVDYAAALFDLDITGEGA